jgi:hypothetical protein
LIKKKHVHPISGEFRFSFLPERTIPTPGTRYQDEKGESQALRSRHRDFGRPYESLFPADVKNLTIFASAFFNFNKRNTIYTRGRDTAQRDFFQSLLELWFDVRVVCASKNSAYREFIGEIEVYEFSHPGLS